MGVGIFDALGLIDPSSDGFPVGAIGLPVGTPDFDGAALGSGWPSHHSRTLVPVASTVDISSSVPGLQNTRPFLAVQPFVGAPWTTWKEAAPTSPARSWHAHWVRQGISKAWSDRGSAAAADAGAAARRRSVDRIVATSTRR